MGRSSGTGRPLTLRCGKCKILRDWRSSSTDDTRLAATGRVAPLTKSQKGSGGAGVLQFRAEYRCLRCGHVGWSRHGHMKALLLRDVVQLCDIEGPTIAKSSRAVIRVTREDESHWYGVLVDERGATRSEHEGMYPKFAWRIESAAS